MNRIKVSTSNELFTWFTVVKQFCQPSCHNIVTKVKWLKKQCTLSSPVTWDIIYLQRITKRKERKTQYTQRKKEIISSVSICSTYALSGTQYHWPPSTSGCHPGSSVCGLGLAVSKPKDTGPRLLSTDTELWWPMMAYTIYEHEIKEGGEF